MKQIQNGQIFRKLHAESGVVLMPNAWDAGSARMLAAAGFSAIGTTSAGIAFARGLPDYDGRVTRPEMLDCVGRITAAVDLPVSADLEAGYGIAPQDVAQTIALFIQAGVVGGNIEDCSGDARCPLFDAGLASERIAAARQAADSSGFPFTLTARTDCYLAGVDDPFSEAVRRSNAYRAAGADCLFVPGIKDAATIAALVREIDGPLSVVMGLAGTTLTVAELAALGVKRISIGGSLARATFGLIRRAAQEMREQGSFTFADQQIPDNELCRFFASWDDPA